MSTVHVLLLMLTCAFASATPQQEDEPKPKWYKQFSIHFEETTRLLPPWVKRQTSGIWWYDAVQQAEVIDRMDGSGDRYCGSIHPFTHTPCRHLVTGGRHYLIFPELHECCMCCTSEQGCGPLSPTWLQNATFEGEEEMKGLQTYKWSIKGLQTNNYYSTADSDQLPVELDQVPNDLQSFHVDTFKKGPVPATLLRVPEGCAPSCPLFSVCSLLKLKSYTH